MDTRIVIIGAGVAGLSAAHHLFQNGFNNVIILEAIDRIGGRINTSHFGEGLIELGAAWIHGIGPGNFMYTLAKSKGLLMETNNYIDCCKQEEHWYTEKGTFIDRDIVKKAWTLFEEIEGDIEKGKDISDKRVSCYDYIQSSLDKKMTLTNMSPVEQTEIKLLFNSIISFFGGEIGDDLRVVSAYYYQFMQTISTDDVILPHGLYQTLEILNQVVPGETIKFKRRVTNVNWENQSEKIAKITCEVNGETEEYIADHVIVTCSLGHLKRYHIALFNPSLPKQKVDAIKRLGYGQTGKIFLSYDTPFWKKGDGNIRIAWDKIDDAYNKDSWYKSVYLISEVLTCPKVLLVWVHGNGVLQMESISEREVMKTCTSILRKFLNSTEIPEPASVRRSSWSTDSLFLGAYCYYSVISERNDVEDIAEPVYIDNKPILCFAGEATHTKLFSYAHGARSSGIREAERMIKFNTKK